jgi:hypothetical protein
MNTKHYVVLVLMREGFRGDISDIKPSTAAFGKKECPPTYTKVDFFGTPKEAVWLRSNARYDFDAESFVHKATGDVCDFNEDIIEDESYDDNANRCRILARQLNNGNDVQINPCRFLRAKHVSLESDDRVHFLRVFYPFRKRSGVKRLLKAVKKGLYPDIRESFRALDVSIQREIIQSCNNEDREYIIWLGSIKPSDIE